MPQLKSFLKDGEAESYRNVEVKFISGRKAVMTVYEGISKDNLVPLESIVLRVNIKLRYVICICYTCDLFYGNIALTFTLICRRKCMH